MDVSAEDVYCSFLPSPSESSWSLLSSGSENDYCDHTRCYNFLVRKDTNLTPNPPLSEDSDSEHNSYISGDDSSVGSGTHSDSSAPSKSADPVEGTTPSKPILKPRELASPSTKVRAEVMKDFFDTKAKVQSVAIHNTMIPLCNHWFPDFKHILLLMVPNDNHNSSHLCNMIAETTFNYAAIPIKRVEDTTHQPNADHDRWAIAIPGGVVTSGEHAHDVIQLTCVSPEGKKIAKKVKVLGRPVDRNVDWFQKGVLDTEWKDVLRKNLWEEETMDKVASLLGIKDEWDKMKATDFSNQSKWPAHRNENGELYMYQKQWLFHALVGRHNDKMPFRKGFCEGKGRDTTCAQVCFGRYLDRNTGTMSDKTLLSVDYFVEHGIIAQDEVPGNFSIRQHLETLMRGEINVNAFREPSTFALVTISDPEIDLNEAMKIMRAKSKAISYNKITSNKPMAIDAICSDVIRPLADCLTREDFLYEADFNDATERVPGLWDWIESNSEPPRGLGKEIVTMTEKEMFHTPLILEQPDFIEYCKRPYDSEADENMRKLLSTTPRLPTYTESEEMENKRKDYTCSPPFINTMFTLQINPGNYEGKKDNNTNTPGGKKKTKKAPQKIDKPGNENRINTSKANMLWIAVKVAHVLFLAMKRASKMEPDLEAEFLELCRALPYWIRCFNVNAYFKNHWSVRNKKGKKPWYTKLSEKQFFTDQNMHLIGATMFITTLIDSALDHPCQHVLSTTDTRDLLQVITYGKQDSKDWALRYIMKPEEALRKAKLKLNHLETALSAIANKDATLEDQMFQLSKFFFTRKICLLYRYY